MFRRRQAPNVASLLAVLALVAGACAPSDDAPPEDDGEATVGLTEEEGNRIRQAGRAWVEAMRAGDVDSLTSLYAEDAVLMPPGAPAVQGRQAIAEFMAAMPAFETIELTHEDIEGQGDLAYARGSYLMSFLAVPGDTASVVTERGKFVEIRERREDGSWPMVVDIWNANGSAP